MNYWDDEKIIKRFYDKLEKTENCWNYKGAIHHSGYGVFCIKKKALASHRVSFEIFNKNPINEGMYILHSCDNRKCCNPLHLSEGTHQDNMDDKVKKNRQSRKGPQGSSHPRSKLTEKDVIDIRKKYSLGISRKELINEYIVSESTICLIILRKIWLHV